MRRHVRGIFRFAIALWTALFAAYFVLGHLASLAAAALTVPDGLMRSEIGYRPSLILPWTDPPVAAWGPVALSGMPLVIYFALVVVAIAASVSWTLVRSPTLPSEVRNLAAFQGVRARSDALLLVHIFLIHFALVAVYYIALYVAGITFRTPGFDRMEDWEIAFHLANASVYEEVVTRVVLLGLPLLAFHAARGRMAPLRRYVLGGGLAFDRPAILLTIFSTWVFGYAHVVYGWDLWKLPPTLLGGLMFAYLFVRRGLHAAIVFHFMIDYLGTVEAMGFPWWYAGPLILLAGVLVLSSVPLGLWLAYRYSLKGLARSRTRRGAGRAAGGPDGRDAHPRG